MAPFDGRDHFRARKPYSLPHASQNQKAQKKGNALQSWGRQPEEFWEEKVRKILYTSY